MRTCGFSGVFQPTADIGLQPLWSRHYETFGDDPYLTSVMTRATQDGLQSKTSMDPYNFNFSTKVPMSAAIEKDSIMTVAILKHWIGYSTPDSGHDRQVATVCKRNRPSPLHAALFLSCLLSKFRSLIGCWNNTSCPRFEPP